jgi:hypothetical protein
MRTWTQDEIRILVENYDTATNAELAKIIPGKSKYGIYKKAYKMGLRKNAEVEFKNRSEARSGPRAANWKGGVRMTRNGYRQIRAPGHPRSDSAGYVMEHIIVWEINTGIQVPKNCCVHHLNGNKADNRIENLCLMEFGAHTTFHHNGKKRPQETRKKISERKKKYVSQQGDFDRKIDEKS